MSDNTCAQCNGYGWEETHEDRHPCYHCRTTGKCECEECHPTQEDTRIEGWGVYVIVPIYNNMDGIVGTRTELAAIFTSKHCANDYADKFNPQDGDYSDIQAEVKSCKFKVVEQTFPDIQPL